MELSAGSSGTVLGKNILSLDSGLGHEMDFNNEHSLRLVKK